MGNVLIVCESGISAALFVSKFLEEAKKNNMDKTIIDYAPISRVNKKLEENMYDVLILTPQVARHDNDVRKSIEAVAKQSELYFMEAEDFNHMNVGKVFSEVFDNE